MGGPELKIFRFINGDLRKVATNTYVVTPSNVELSGEKITATQEAAFAKE